MVVVAIASLKTADDLVSSNSSNIPLTPNQPPAASLTLQTSIKEVFPTFFLAKKVKTLVLHVNSFTNNVQVPQKNDGFLA